MPETTEYKVRGGCYLQDPLDDTQVHEPGTSVFLTGEQFSRVAHLVEPAQSPVGGEGATDPENSETGSDGKKKK